MPSGESGFQQPRRAIEQSCCARLQVCRHDSGWIFGHPDIEPCNFGEHTIAGAHFERIWVGNVRWPEVVIQSLRLLSPCACSLQRFITGVEFRTSRVRAKSSDFTARGCFYDHGFDLGILIWPCGRLLSRRRGPKFLILSVERYAVEAARP